MAYRVEAANAAYTGEVAGVAFVNGVADGLDAVPDYFYRHHGYKVTRIQNQKSTMGGSARKVEEK